jgi:protease IV
MSRAGGHLPYLFPGIFLPFMALLFLLGACSPKFFTRSSDPLREFTLEGTGDQKVLLVPLRGTISASPERGLLGTRPSMVQEVVSHLQKARKDPNVKAVLLEIDSPGGSVVDSDILFHELERYKAETGAKAVTLMMSIVASGGYYAALASDRIVAHPQSITGSVGTIFIRPNVQGLMTKLGVEAEVSKSGPHKDMASPFRSPLPDEKEMIQAMIDDLNRRFLELAAAKRSLTEDQSRTIATARIFTARQAKEIGLVDSIGYLEDALHLAREIAGMPEDSRLVVYRRTKYENDNAYNPITTEGGEGVPSMIQLRLPGFLSPPETGFYYLWAPEQW